MQRSAYEARLLDGHESPSLTFGLDSLEMQMDARIVAYENVAHRRRFETLHSGGVVGESRGVSDGHVIHGVQRRPENRQRITNGLGVRTQQMLRECRNAVEKVGMRNMR